MASARSAGGKQGDLRALWLSRRAACANGRAWNRSVAVGCRQLKGLAAGPGLHVVREKRRTRSKVELVANDEPDRVVPVEDGAVVHCLRGQPEAARQERQRVRRGIAEPRENERAEREILAKDLLFNRAGSDRARGGGRKQRLRGRERREQEGE